jgi:hypothetical protein
MNAIATNFETWTTPGAPAPVRAHPPRKSPLKLRLLRALDRLVPPCPAPKEASLPPHWFKYPPI